MNREEKVKILGCQVPETSRDTIFADKFFEGKTHTNVRVQIPGNVDLSSIRSLNGAAGLFTGTITTRTSWRRCTARGTRTSSISRGWQPRRSRRRPIPRRTNTRASSLCPVTATPSWIWCRRRRHRSRFPFPAASSNRHRATGRRARAPTCMPAITRPPDTCHLISAPIHITHDPPPSTGVPWARRVETFLPKTKSCRIRHRRRHHRRRRRMKS